MYKNKDEESNVVYECEVSKDEWEDGFFEALKRKKKKKLIAIIAAAVLALVILSAVCLAGYNAAQDAAAKKIKKLQDRIDTLENTPYVLENVTPEIVTDVLEEGVSETGKLVSAEYYFTNAAKFTDTSGIIGILDWMTEKSFVQKWDGCIKAGIDMSKVAVEIKGGVIIVTVPEAEILSYEVDYDSVEVFNEMNNVFNPISVKDKNSFDKATAEEMKERAVKNGLLTRAQENAAMLIKDLINKSVPGAKSFTIEFVVATPEE